MSDRKLVRRWMPTFRGYPERRDARHAARETGYDVMISNDSWLAAMLTDTIVGNKVRDMMSGFDIIEDMPMAGAWRRTFDGVIATINKRAWEATIAHYGRKS